MMEQEQLETVKYIAYRYYYITFLGWTYERVELDRKHLDCYLRKNMKDINEIEIFRKEDCKKIEFDLVIEE